MNQAHDIDGMTEADVQDHVIVAGDFYICALCSEVYINRPDTEDCVHSHVGTCYDTRHNRRHGP